MALELDDRQRAMLLEMGVRVWMPGTSFAPPSPPQQQTAPRPTSASHAQSLAAAPAAKPVQPQYTPPAPQIKSTANSALQAIDGEALAMVCASCQACGLCACRKHSTLSGETLAAQADWMVVGDPPDEEEDQDASPFAGQAGVLLGNMLRAVGVQRGSAGAQGAYVTNVVKCRPPHGHVVQTAELAQCAQFLNREIELIQPKMIVSMGRFANQLLLSEHAELANLPLGKLRGTLYRYQGIPVLVTYHPKVLLRASADKAKAWADLCLAVKALRI
jgi:DNA polymerase